jgi:pyrimidine operon attenuation protein/uracil phosphoribosyltransferase
VPLPDAEALCVALATQMQPRIDRSTTVLVGIHTGGVWVAEKLAAALGLQTPAGSIDVSFYRDDYGKRGLHANANGKKVSNIPFDIENAHVIIVDDVLYTGRTIRAAVNELFDYGRPQRVELAVLVDRGGRELPVAPTFCPHTETLLANQTLELERSGDGKLAFRLKDKPQ